MEPATQAKMLNCFDRYGIVRYTPVGATNQETSHVRFVATTNVPLAELVETGRMRQDFKERIDVFRLNMPSLNAEDVPILAYHFFRQLALQYGPDVEISVGAVRHLQRKFWPGNARQLHHEITRGFARMQDGVLHAGDLVDETDAHTGDRAAQINQGDFYLATLQSLGNLSDREFAEFSAKHGGLYAASDLFERAMIERALRMRIKTNRMQSIANILDVNRTTLYKKMLEYGLTKDPIDEGGSADQIISIHSQGAAPDDSKGNKPNRKAATA
jgi:DNA-binding NtrC family response regulator